MKRAPRFTGVRKKLLDLCKGRLLGKHDTFEVVLYPATDPGADKRGLLRSGQVLSTREDTGGARSLPTLRNSSREGTGIGTAQLIQFTGTCILGQTFSFTERVPVAKRLGVVRAPRVGACDAAAPVVLLSPACASYDQFKDFEQRGDAFRSLVAKLPRESAPGPTSAGAAS